MVEGARLESVFRGNSNVGSNPTLSASTCGAVDHCMDQPLAGRSHGVRYRTSNRTCEKRIAADLKRFRLVPSRTE